jgi:hypothetical protein
VPRWLAATVAPDFKRNEIGERNVLRCLWLQPHWNGQFQPRIGRGKLRRFVGNALSAFVRTAFLAH